MYTTVDMEQFNIQKRKNNQKMYYEHLILFMYYSLKDNELQVSMFYVRNRFWEASDYWPHNLLSDTEVK